MEPFEVMTSESQERMLAIVRPDDLARVEELCRRWEVRATVVGRVTGSGRLRVLDGFDGEVLADVPASSLHDDAPQYRRPLEAPAALERRRADDPSRLPAPADCGADLLAMLADPSWVWSQYDHQLFLNTVEGPGFASVDVRISRTIPLHGERAQLRLIGEAFNVTNRANFNNFNRGQYTFNATTRVFTPTTNFLVRTGSDAPRILQLAAKITF